MYVQFVWRLFPKLFFDLIGLIRFIRFTKRWWLGYLGKVRKTYWLGFWHCHVYEDFQSSRSTYLLKIIAGSHPRGFFSCNWLVGCSRCLPPTTKRNWTGIQLKGVSMNHIWWRPSSDNHRFWVFLIVLLMCDPCWNVQGLIMEGSDDSQFVFQFHRRVWDSYKHPWWVVRPLPLSITAQSRNARVTSSKEKFLHWYDLWILPVSWFWPRCHRHS